MQWIFLSDSKSGFMLEQKEPRKRLSKWGNDLRQTYRIVAASGASEIDCRLLMNRHMLGSASHAWHLMVVPQTKR